MIIKNADESIDLSIIIPALNEGDQISRTLDDINGFLEKKKISYEIIVIDDGSLDGTAILAKEHGAHIVIQNAKPVGKGSAIRLGFSKASGRIILFMDADGVYNPRDIPRILEPISKGKADFVIGSSNIPHYREQSIKFYSIILRKIIKLYLGIDLDIFSNFKAAKLDTLNKLLPFSSASGDLFDSEIIILAIKHGFKIVEIPIRRRLRDYSGYSRSKFSWTLNESILATISLLRLSFRYG
jgi:glycosyltransferase involved in cell wall biosynthesis